MIFVSHSDADGDLSAECVDAPRTVGVARSERPYAGEVARSRVMTANGQMFIVAAAEDVWVEDSYIVGAYPVTKSHLLLYRQPLVEAPCATYSDALMRHDLFVQILVEDGARALRAQEALRARSEVAEARHAQEYHLSLN